MENVEQQDGLNTLSKEVISKYRDIGFQCAGETQAHPETISNGLSKVLAVFRDDSQAVTKLRIRKLKEDIKSINEEKTDCATALKNAQEEVEKKMEDIKFLKEKRNGIRNKRRDTAELINVGLQVFGLFVLSLFLYIFYASVGYSVLTEKNHGYSTILNPDVFREAWSQGGGALGVVFLIPAIVLAFGLLIHYFLDKIGKNEGGRRKWIIFLVLFVAVAFCFDVLVGSKISQSLYIADFDAGRTSVQWVWWLVLRDINFYLILILGFVAYLAWGVLLHAIISNPVLDINDQIRRADKEVKEAENELLKLKKEVNVKEGDLKKLDETIRGKVTSLNHYENGGVYYDLPLFRGMVGVFMDGYSAYVTGRFEGNETAKQIMNVAEDKKVAWVGEVEKTLTEER